MERIFSGNLSGIDEESGLTVAGELPSKTVLLLITLGIEDGIFDGVAVNNAVGLVEVGNLLGKRVVGNIERDGLTLGE